MARPLVFTANGREPPGRHLSSTRFQNAFSTGVEAALASLLGFTSEQPDGGRSHCGAPGSRTTALVCPEALGAAEFTRNPFAKPEGIALSPKTHGLSEDLAAVASPEAAPSTQPELGGDVPCSEETSTGDTKIAGGESEFLRGGTSSTAQTRSSRSLR